MGRPYAFPSPGLSPEHLASQISSMENTRNDMVFPPVADFHDIETDSNVSSSLDVDLRTLLVNPAQQQHPPVVQTRGRALSDGVLQRGQRGRNANDRRYSDAGSSINQSINQTIKETIEVCQVDQAINALFETSKT